MVFVNADFVVTVRHGDHGRLSDVRKRMDSNPEQMRLGPFAVMHAIADAVVDHGLEVTQLMEGDIDAIEEEAFARGPPHPDRADLPNEARGGRAAQVGQPAVDAVRPVAEQYVKPSR